LENLIKAEIQDKTVLSTRGIELTPEAKHGHGLPSSKTPHRSSLSPMSYSKLKGRMLAA
jgi:hypothetical protein